MGMNIVVFDGKCNCFLIVQRWTPSMLQPDRSSGLWDLQLEQKKHVKCDITMMKLSLYVKAIHVIHIIQERRLKRLNTLGGLEIGIQHKIVNALELSTPRPKKNKTKKTKTMINSSF